MTTNGQSKNVGEIAADIKKEGENLAAVANAIIADAKTRAPRVYRITPDSFASQVRDMDHKDLFIIREAIDVELAKRKADAEELVKELGGKV